MNPDIKKFEELLKTDVAFQEKIRVAIENFTGDLTDIKAVFESAILPVAKEAGLSAAFEEYQAYVEQNQKPVPSDGAALSSEELAQVAGGKGFGVSACYGYGIGIGSASDDDAAACVGLGFGGCTACAGEGVST